MEIQELNVNHRDQSKLPDELTFWNWDRIREIICIGVSAVLSLAAVAKLVVCTAEAPFNLAAVTSLIVAFFFGIMEADFISGLFHWTIDNWGSINIPYFGKSLIMPFREHHYDPNEITRSHFIVTWGDSCMTSIPFLSVVVYLLYFLEGQQMKEVLWMCTIAILGTTASNQIHKSAHTHIGNPKWVDWLQRMHILVPKFLHHKHHMPPYTNNYCVVTGWANYPLEYINFWENLEWIIERVTGLKPRQDDMKWSKKKQKFMKLSIMD